MNAVREDLSGAGAPSAEYIIALALASVDGEPRIGRYERTISGAIASALRRAGRLVEHAPTEERTEREVASATGWDSSNDLIEHAFDHLGRPRTKEGGELTRVLVVRLAEGLRAALTAAGAAQQYVLPEERIEAATWALIEWDTDTADRGVRDEHYRERRAEVERIAPILAAGVAPQEPGWSTADRRSAEAEARSRWPIGGAQDRVSERDQIIFQQGCINGFMLGAEWWKARAAAGARTRSSGAEITQQEPSGARCTCPSGDGSLRWPCPSHQPTPTSDREKLIAVGGASVGVHPPTGHVWVERGGSVLAHVYDQAVAEEIVAALDASPVVDPGPSVLPAIPADEQFHVAQGIIAEVIDALTDSEGHDIATKILDKLRFAKVWPEPAASPVVDEAKIAEVLPNLIFQYNQERITVKTFARAVVEALGGAR